MKRDIQKIRQERMKLARMVKDSEYKVCKVHEQGDKIKINHKETAHAFLKFIHGVPGILPLTKQVMTLRLMGQSPKYNPLTLLQVALCLGLREHEVEALEKEGIEIAQNFLKRMNLQESIDKFNRDGQEKVVKRIIT